MLKRIRTLFAFVFFVLITFLFLDFTGSIHTWFGWMAKIQFLPAIMALNFVVIAILILLTLLLGRLYCSVICPLGVFQDCVSWVSSKRKKNRFGYSLPLNGFRYTFLGLFIVLLVVGFTAIASFIEPYSIYGRIVNNLFLPVYQWGNNLLAYYDANHRIDSYSFYEVDVWIKSIPVFVVTIIMLIVILILSWRGGRTYCNSVCPVGTVLGFLSRFSLLKIRIDDTKCNSCGLCARNCKSSCIDSKTHLIDYSRCVDCMNCIDKCKKGAIQYCLPRKKNEVKEREEHIVESVDDNRRKFLSLTAFMATTATLKAQQIKMDGGLALIEDKKKPLRFSKITPPVSKSIRNFSTRCTACQLCVSACPNKVLRPSNELTSFMQPELSYERGYCRPECT